MNPNTGEPVNPPSSPNPLASLEGVVAAAQEAAAQTTPKAQFENQFGSPQVTTPQVADATVPGLIDTALANLESTPPPPTNNLAPEQTQPIAENLAQPKLEQTPADPKQEFRDSVEQAAEKLIASLEAKPEEKVAA